MDSTPDLESDGENDTDGYFLEPSFCATSIGERIAEANRQLFDEQVARELAEDDRPRKVQFCDDLVDFAPDTPENQRYSSDQESVIEPEEEEGEEEEVEEEKTVEEGVKDTEPEEPPDEETTRKEGPEIDDPNDETTNTKLLLVLLPREQSSSCESIMGEEPDEEEEDEEEKIVEGKTELPKVRPKSAHKGAKHKRAEKIQCKLVTICPELTSSLESENRAWHESQKLRQRTKPRIDPVKASLVLEPEQVLNQRPVSCQEGTKNAFPVMRPKTAPNKRSCCVIRSDLPQYNGFRSEYGLSAQQLQERKLKNAEIRQQRKQLEINKIETERRKRQDNEAKFSSWLEEKTNKPKPSSRKIDTLVRSDVFIQKNAIYASKCGVPYAVDYTRSKNKIDEIRKKTINLGKLFESLPPHAQKTYQIYVGNKNY